MKTKSYRLVLLASLSALASGCAGAWNGAGQALTVAEEHPISVDSQVVTMTMPLETQGSALSSMDKARLRAFSDSYLTSGYGPLTITAPEGASSDAAGQKLAAQIRDYLHETGVNADAINAAVYRVGSDRKRDLILSYTHYVATAPVCGVWDGMRKRDYGNLRSPNFGCAQQNNIAAMVADPRDLVTPADSTSPDANARARMLKMYRAGQPTTTTTDANATVQIAQ